jgi:hypothetical protein
MEAPAPGPQARKLFLSTKICFFHLGGKISSCTMNMHTELSTAPKELLQSELDKSQSFVIHAFVNSEGRLF